MKRCSYCGAEYPDSALECAVDKTSLGGGEASVADAAEPVEASPVLDGPQLSMPTVTTPSQAVPATRWTERHLRIFELVLVCTVAFGSSLFYSTLHVLGLNPGIAFGAITRWLYSTLYEGAALGLTWYVLLRRSKSFRDLGFSWASKDLGPSVLLFIAGTLVYSIEYSILYATGLNSTARPEATARVGGQLFGGGISLITPFFQFINPFYEELIVRAYVITEMRELTGSVSRAVTLSTVLQTAYHLYQGVPLAFSSASLFLLFSIYYAKTNRITPIILAHLLMDVGATLVFLLRH